MKTGGKHTDLHTIIHVCINCAFLKEKKMEICSQTGRRMQRHRPASFIMRAPYKITQTM